MSLAVTLPEATVEAAPGRSSPLEVVLGNDGPAVEDVHVEVVGRAGPWVQLLDGPSTRLEPGARLTLPLAVTAPAGAARSGQLVPFTVLARTASGTSARATGLVLVLSAPPVSATLVPGTVRSATTSQHALEVSTDDPTGVLVTLTARPTDTRASVVVDPVAVRVEPGRPASASVTVRPARAAVLGLRPHAFEVVWETDGPDGTVRGSCSGRLEQTPRLPPVVSALLALLLLVGLAAAAWSARSARDDAGGARSEATAGAPSATTTAALADEVAVVHVQPQDADPDAARASAQAVADGLALDDDLRAEVVDSTQLPGRFRPGYWLVVVRGFDDRAAVGTFCGDPPPGAPACQIAR